MEVKNYINESNIFVKNLVLTCLNDPNAKKTLYRMQNYLSKIRVKPKQLGEINSFFEESFPRFPKAKLEIENFSSFPKLNFNMEQSKPNQNQELIRFLANRASQNKNELDTLLNIPKILVISYLIII